MGLDLRLSRIDEADEFHARWSYSGFAAFRAKLAERIGITLDEMVGFGGEKPWPSEDAEPLVYLLNHSDCDGELGYEACYALAPRLREVLESWDGMDDYDAVHASRLVAMCEEVARDDASMVVFQ